MCSSLRQNMSYGIFSVPQQATGTDQAETVEEAAGTDAAEDDEI